VLVGLWVLATRWTRTILAADRLREEQQTPAAVAQLPTSPDFRIAEPGSGSTPHTGAVESAEATRYKQGLVDAARLQQDARAAAPPVVAATLDVATLAQVVSVAIDPDRTVPLRIAAGIAVPGRLTSAVVDPLSEVMAYPLIDTPMYGPLVARSTELFLPNLNLIERNSLTLLEVNQRFVEAYMVGLNHEFARELLWREYPTDRRGSPFLRFWPRADGGDDVAPLDAWTGDLEDQLTLANVGVLLVRGDVVRRFPDMVVAAAPAASPQQPDPDQSTWQPPLFVLPIDASTAAYAFDVGPDALLDENAGFFFVFQEHSHRLRFGFDLESEDFESWNQLDWARVPMDRSFAFAGRRIDPGPQDPDDRAWDSDAADIARITLQQPFRLAIHATQLVGSLA
jgi:hypothetical protein